ncbi:MAG: DUF1772 domain-containing protein [Alphaproteobacteria bacterium]|nr:DUF1772 domain-containing protein [Alphaproteobacteria bacterium]
MLLKTFRFLSLMFVGLSMGAALAHLFELPNKIGLPAEAYLTVQQNYRGWSLLGIVVIGALVSTLILAVLVRGRGTVFWLSLGALLCILGAQAVFWTFTYPANVATQNWTMLPDNWMQLRSQWEYSHAAGAGFNLAAFVCLVLSLLCRQERR